MVVCSGARIFSEDKPVVFFHGKSSNKLSHIHRFDADARAAPFQKKWQQILEYFFLKSP
jgi:hypothetical protein